MNSLPKIPALFFVLLLTFNAMGAEPGLANLPAQHNKENSSSIYPANNPNLFAIHHEKKTGTNLLDQLPKSNSADHSQDHPFGQRVESSFQKHTAIYLRFSKTIVGGLTVKKLIFPFHSHW